MFFLAVNIIKKNCVIGKQGFSLFPFFVLGIVPIFANDNYTLTRKLHIFAAVLRGICKVFLRKHGYGKAQAPGPVLDGLWPAVRVHTKTLRTVLLHGPEGLFQREANAPRRICLWTRRDIPCFPYLPFSDPRRSAGLHGTRRSPWPRPGTGHKIKHPHPAASTGHIPSRT